VSAVPKLTFVDTNILIYAHDSNEGMKHDIARQLVRRLWQDGTGVLSTQVLQEFYAVVTRKPLCMSKADARERMADYSQWCSVNTDPQLLVSASMLQQNHSISWWDALIIEAAMRSGATTLLSEDMQHGRKFGLMTVVNPFREN
jgi:predicted nucleic acid-binding protein